MNDLEKTVLYYLGKSEINTTSKAVEHLSRLYPYKFKNIRSAFSHAFLNLWRNKYLLRERSGKSGPYVYSLTEGGKEKLLDLIFYRGKDSYFKGDEIWPKLPIDKDYNQKPINRETIEKMTDKNTIQTQKELLELIKQKHDIEKKIQKKYSDLSKSIYGFDVFVQEKEEDNKNFEEMVNELTWSSVKPLKNDIFGRDI